MRIALLSRLTHVAEPVKPTWINVLEQALTRAGHEAHCVALPFQAQTIEEFTQSSLSIKFLTFMNIDRVVIMEPTLLVVSHPYKIGLVLSHEYEHFKMPGNDGSCGSTDNEYIGKISFTTPDFADCKRIIYSDDDTDLQTQLTAYDIEKVRITLYHNEISAAQWSEISNAIVA